VARCSPIVESMIPTFDPLMRAMLVTDAVTHEHDLRGALGVPGDRDSDAIEYAFRDRLNRTVQDGNRLELVVEAAVATTVLIVRENTPECCGRRVGATLYPAASRRPGSRLEDGKRTQYHAKIWPRQLHLETGRRRSRARASRACHPL
jgi:hypothetical protein